MTPDRIGVVILLNACCLLVNGDEGVNRRLLALESQVSSIREELSSCSEWRKSLRVAENDHVVLGWMQKLLKELRIEVAEAERREEDALQARRVEEKRRDEAQKIFDRRIAALEKRHFHRRRRHQSNHHRHQVGHEKETNERKRRLKKHHLLSSKKELEEELDDVDWFIRQLLEEQSRQAKVLKRLEKKKAI